jgi:hypothetical protein
MLEHMIGKKTVARQRRMVYLPAYDTMVTSRPLESYRAFPYVAWALVLGFALLVYVLTVEVRDLTTTLKVKIEERNQLLR